MKNIDVGQAISILANIGILLSIVFLAIEISQNQATIEESNTLNLVARNEALYASGSNFRRLIAENEEVARIWVNGRAGNDLTPLEAERFDQLCGEFFWRETVAFIRNALLDETTERPVRVVREALRANPGLKECWDRRSRDFPELRAAVESEQSFE